MFPWITYFHQLSSAIKWKQCLLLSVWTNMRNALRQQDEKITRQSVVSIKSNNRHVQWISHDGLRFCLRTFQFPCSNRVFNAPGEKHIPCTTHHQISFWTLSLWILGDSSDFIGYKSVISYTRWWLVHSTI